MRRESTQHGKEETKKQKSDSGQQASASTRCFERNVPKEKKERRTEKEEEEEKRMNVKVVY